MSLVAIGRSFNADLCAHVILSIIVSESKVNSVER